MKVTPAMHKAVKWFSKQPGESASLFGRGDPDLTMVHRLETAKLVKCIPGVGMSFATFRLTDFGRQIAAVPELTAAQRAALQWMADYDRPETLASLRLRASTVKPLVEARLVQETGGGPFGSYEYSILPLGRNFVKESV